MDPKQKQMRALKRKYKAYEELTRACHKLGFAIKKLHTLNLILVGDPAIVIAASEILEQPASNIEEPKIEEK